MNVLLIIIPLIFLLPVLPLYFVIKMLGGDGGFFKVLLIKIVAAVVALVLSIILGGVGPIALAILLIFIYKSAFDLSIGKAILAWLLEIVVMVILLIIAVLVFGVALIGAAVA